MSGNFEQSPPSDTEQFNMCFVNPALLPDWFWLPTAHQVEQQGHNYFIPQLRRGDPAVSVEENVDVIEDTMQDKRQQFIVVLSRGIEFGIRYIDRLAQKETLGKVMGWMVISSVGPRGYEITADETSKLQTRHTPLYMWGLDNESGLEVMDKDIARASLLHDLNDDALCDITVNNLQSERPLSNAEVAKVPHLKKHVLPLSWYIGRNDKVDNTSMSAAVAKHRFGVEPEYTDWGHIGPLSHTDEVAQAVLIEAERAYKLREVE